MELLALVLGLGLHTFQESFSTQACPLQNSQLVDQLSIFLSESPYGLLSLSVGVGLNPDLVVGVLDPFLSYENLLGNLHRNNKGNPCKEKETE